MWEVLSPESAVSAPCDPELVPLWPAASGFKSWADARRGGGSQACRDWLTQPSPASTSSEVGPGKKTSQEEGRRSCDGQAALTEGVRLVLAGLRILAWDRKCILS